MPKDLLTLESVRPDLKAKGSFKNSKSKGQISVKKACGTQLKQRAPESDP